jgi:hypothetical protein
VSAGLFAVAFLASAGFLGWWFDQRFPRLAPADFRLALIHVFAATVANQLLDARASTFVAGLPIPGSRVVAVMGVILPLVAYAVVATIWTLRLAQRSLSGHFR